MLRAFTLIETVVTIALSVILVLAIAQLYVVYGSVISVQESSIAITLGANGVADATRTAGLQADHIVATHTFSGIAYNSGTTTAVFELPAVNTSGDIIANTYDYIGIYASGTDAYQIVDAAPGSTRTSGKKRLTSVLDALAFSYDNASIPASTSITLDATTTALVKGETKTVHLHEYTRLRNL